jgi:hypothetical protein
MAINVILLIILFKGCNCVDCEVVGERRWTDTIRTENPPVVVIDDVPTPKKIIPRKNIKASILSAVLQNSEGSLPAMVAHSTDSSDRLSGASVDCDDLVEYDTTYYEVDNYRIRLQEWVMNNRIINRKINHQNLKPSIVEHVEKTIEKKKTIEVFAGAFGGFQRPYSGGAWNWTVGPEVFIEEPHGVVVGYGFDAKNNGHAVHLLYKIKLKK